MSLRQTSRAETLKPHGNSISTHERPKTRHTQTITNIQSHEKACKNPTKQTQFTSQKLYHHTIQPVSYTHLDVYKRQINT